MDSGYSQALVQFLSTFITSNKQEQIKRVLQERTRYITLLFEDTYQSHNASAIIRSAEIFGVQDVCAVEKRNSFAPTMGVSKGALKWITIHRYPTSTQAIMQLKERGYKIVATLPDPTAVTLEELPLDNKMVLLFGNELVGLTPEAIGLADMFVYIPMYGFTQSFNVSVCAALCLQSIHRRLRNSTINWRLTEIEKLELELSWLRILIAHAPQVEEEFKKTYRV